jgi:beta-lactamase class D
MIRYQLGDQEKTQRFSTEAQRGHNRVTPFSFFKIVNSTFWKVETMFHRFFYSIGWEFRVD